MPERSAVNWASIRFNQDEFVAVQAISAFFAAARAPSRLSVALVRCGITLVTGTEDRQWLYSAMTRGTRSNLVFVSTTPAKAADPAPGTRPAPELSRYDRNRHRRAGDLPAQPQAPPRGPGPREPIAVLADILDRDGTQLSATETRRRNLANADHLATLNAIWAAETQEAQNARYRGLVMAALPPE